MCGVVDGGIIAGLWGYEAGQSGVGDIFDWFVDHPGAARRTPPRRPSAGISRARAPHRAGRRRRPSASTACVALDWHSGNRSVLVDHELSGLVVGQTLATRPEDIYRALLEATAFGTRMIVETFDDAGRPGHRARRRRRPAEEPAADADLRRRARTCRCRPSAPSRARRSARRSTPPSPPAPTPTSRAAAARDGPGQPRRATSPIPANVAAYDELFAEYRALHDHFGRGGNDVMHRLKAIRRAGRRSERHDEDRSHNDRSPTCARRSPRCTPS